MTKVRHLVFHSVEVSGDSQILLSHLFIVFEAVVLMIPYYVFQRMDAKGIDGGEQEAIFT